VNRKPAFHSLKQHAHDLRTSFLTARGPNSIPQGQQHIPNRFLPKSCFLVVLPPVKLCRAIR
jgi:hypothetical protein